LVKELDVAWTTRILQSGQAADTASTSRACSMSHPESVGGLLLPPFWSIRLKQPLLVVHAGRPKLER